MANHNFQNLEGHSKNCLPFFDGTNYNCWKVRMMLYIQSINYNIWKFIKFGPYVPKRVIKVVGKPDQVIPKPREQYDDEDKRKLLLNAKAKNILYCA